MSEISSGSGLYGPNRPEPPNYHYQALRMCGYGKGGDVVMQECVCETVEPVSSVFTTVQK